MRLLNVHELRLAEFDGDDIPPYAILSHTWNHKQEVSLQDLEKLKGKIPRNNNGFKKIAYSRREASLAGLDWVWIDTCCIDKTNHSELSEAVNSMFQWYTHAQVCFVYLEDVAQRGHSETNQQFYARLQAARWFTRGWTLQELVAPARLKFFSRGWIYLGSILRLDANVSSRDLQLVQPGSREPAQYDLLNAITRITHIPASCLTREKPISHFSVASRMSWAAGRDCTKTEDIAYCLLGLFDINMPLLYGEGKKAFLRLQEEIIKSTDDHTILAWTVQAGTISDFNPMGILAPSPSSFAASENLVQTGRETGGLSQMTKHGLYIELPIRRHQYQMASHFSAGNRPSSTEIFDAIINCGSQMNSRVVLRLLWIHPSISGRKNQFVLLAMSRLTSHDADDIADFSRRDLYIAKHLHDLGHFPGPMGRFPFFDPKLVHFHCQMVPQEASFHMDNSPPENYAARKGMRIMQLPSESWVGITQNEPPRLGPGGLPDQHGQDMDVSFYIEAPIYSPHERYFVDNAYLHIGVYMNFVFIAVRDRPHTTKSSISALLRNAQAGERNSGNYGLVAHHETMIRGYRVTAALQRENPTTAEGEAAGGREHYIVYFQVFGPASGDSPTRPSSISTGTTAVSSEPQREDLSSLAGERVHLPIRQPGPQLSPATRVNTR